MSVRTTAARQGARRDREVALMREALDTAAAYERARSHAAMAAAPPARAAPRAGPAAIGGQAKWRTEAELADALKRESTEKLREILRVWTPEWVQTDPDKLGPMLRALKTELARRGVPLDAAIGATFRAPGAAVGSAYETRIDDRALEELSTDRLEELLFIVMAARRNGDDSRKMRRVAREVREELSRRD